MIASRARVMQGNSAVLAVSQLRAQAPPRLSATAPAFPCAPPGLRRVWQQVALFIGLLAALMTIPALVGRASRIERVGGQAAATPPPVTFAVVWPILYALVACALAFQSLGPVSAATSDCILRPGAAATPCSSACVSPSIRWGGVAVMAAVVVLTLVWPPVFVRNKNRAAALLIVAMLALGGIGAVLASKTSTPATVLWIPLLAWLIFALILTCETAEVQRQQQRSSSSAPLVGQ
jgi:tryptophan-rich sensory protein